MTRKNNGSRKLLVRHAKAFVNRRQCACVFFLTIALLPLAAIGGQESIEGNSTTSKPDPLPEKITVATWNLEWFYDHYKGDNRSELAKKLSAPSREEWDWRLEKIAGVIAKLQPTILALQEVEGQRVVYYLTQKLEKEHKLKYRIAFIQGYDFYTEQDVAIIYREGLVEFSRKEQSTEMFKSNQFRNVQKHLFARFEWGEGDEKQSLEMVNVHLRAQAEREDIRKKQCRLIHHWVKDKIAAGNNVMVIGDLNTEHFKAEKADSDIGVVSGMETESKDDDLVDLNQHLPEDQQKTHMIGRPFDRILVSRAMVDDGEGKDFVFSRIVSRKDMVVQGETDKDHRDVYFDIDQSERDLSDHYPVMAEFLVK